MKGDGMDIGVENRGLILMLLLVAVLGYGCGKAAEYAISYVDFTITFNMDRGAE